MINIISFASRKYEVDADRFEAQAIKSGLFDRVKVYREKDLPESFVNQFGEFIYSNPRGFGYWIWKPFIIFQELQKSNFGDIFIYLDIGFLIYRNQKIFKWYLNVLSESSSDIVAFIKPADHELTGTKEFYRESNWSKGDILDFFNVRENSYVINSPQIISGILILSNSKKSQRLIKEWWDISHKSKHLLTDLTSDSPNCNGFIENRHDQSILSILFKVNNVKVLPTSEVEGDQALFGLRPFLAFRSVGGRFRYKSLSLYMLVRLIKKPSNIINYLKNKI